MSRTAAAAPSSLQALARDIRDWAAELGLQALGIAEVDLSSAETCLLDWLKRGYHGEMDYMARHGTKRSRPAGLVPGTLRVVSVRLDYLPPGAAEPAAVLADPTRGYVARFSLGRDYHKVLRHKLRRLARRMEAAIGAFGYRVFVDSAPVLEKPLAAAAGLGWVGKHTNLLSRSHGSWFVLGEIYTDLPLPADTPATSHCGRCEACMSACPTGAIVAPYQLDARLCISYLTIELRGSIPVALRPPIGNRIFGCDDCQLVCPWNRYARTAQDGDFVARHGLDAPRLVDLMGWTEEEFLLRTEGSAIRRAGFVGWLRNLAVALGNAPTRADVLAALRARLHHPSALVQEHVAWALQQHRRASSPAGVENGPGSDAAR